MTKEELLAKIRPRPAHIRKGQYIFNWIDEHYQYCTSEFYGVQYSTIARDVQYKDGIDCFYDDSKIDEFLDACVKRINEL